MEKDIRAKLDEATRCFRKAAAAAHVLAERQKYQIVDCVGCGDFKNYELESNKGDGMATEDTYAAKVAAVTAYLTADEKAYVEAQGWDRMENAEYLKTYIDLRVEAGDINV